MLPFGLAFFVASLASNMLGPIPTEALHCVLLKMISFKWVANSLGDNPEFRKTELMSAYNSSQLTASMSKVYVATVLYNKVETFHS